LLFLSSTWQDDRPFGCHGSCANTEQAQWQWSTCKVRWVLLRTMFSQICLLNDTCDQVGCWWLPSCSGYLSQ
jgi:hypothetical protein